MKLKNCSTSHYIRAIKNGVVQIVPNLDAEGRPGLNYKKLENIYQTANAEYTRKLQEGDNVSNTENECIPITYADRKTKARKGNVVEEDVEELTLSQLKKKVKKRKRKTLESILFPKTDYDSDLYEPLFKFKVKVSKKKMCANGSSSTSSKSTQSAASEPDTNNAVWFGKDLANVKVKAEAPEMEYFECTETTDMADDSFIAGSVDFIASESGAILVNGSSPLIASEPSTDNDDALLFSEDLATDNVEVETPEVESLTSDGSVNFIAESGSIFDNHKLKSKKSDNFNVSSMIVENMELDNEEIIASEADTEEHVNMQSLVLNSSEDDSYGDLTATASNCFHEHLHQDSDSATDDNDMASVEPKSPVMEKQQNITSVNADVDSNSLNSDNNSFHPDDASNFQEQPSFVSAETPIFLEQPSSSPLNADSEMKLSNHSSQTDIITQASEIRSPDYIKLSFTRKVISPKSQEKLRLAMKSADLSDDMDYYKCEEKLCFEEQIENKFSSSSNVVSPKLVLKKPKNNKKGSPTSKGCLDGPRLCRSLPRLSSGCTSIQGCSESAIAFSQRQMHDIESLASKLITELNSMKVIVEEKMLYEAYRTTSLKNEVDEVKGAIKSATKTEETAKKWLSMMARDCNRFCKIMKLNEDVIASTSVEPVSVEEKTVQRERKKISFADEVGGALCDVKVYEVDRSSLQLKESLS